MIKFGPLRKYTHHHFKDIRPVFYLQFRMAKFMKKICFSIESK